MVKLRLYSRFFSGCIPCISSDTILAEKDNGKESVLGICHEILFHTLNKVVKVSALLAHRSCKLKRGLALIVWGPWIHIKFLNNSISV